MSKQLNVFQRTPIWCFPKADVPLPAPARLAMRIPGGKIVQRLLSQAYVEVTFSLSAQYYTVFPIAKRAEAAARSYLRQQVRDPVVRDKLTPRYAVGCKRPGFHNTYLSTFNRDNVALVTDPIEKITRSGVVTADGEHHDVDVLILATGFNVMDIDSSDVRPHGSGGPITGRLLEREPDAGLRGRQHPGVPQLLLRVRSLRLRRLLVLRADRDADPAHRAVPDAGGPRTAPTGSRCAVQPTTATSPR